MNKLTFKGLTYGALFVAVFYLLSPVITTYGDDQINQNILNGKGYIELIVNLYQFWTGRVILTSILVYLLNVPIIVWRIFNALMLTLLIYSLTEIINGKTLTTVIVSLLILSLPISILSSSAFWITGSLNYLWPTAIMVYLLLVLWRYFKQERISNIHVLFAFLVSILATNMEQSALILVVFYGVILTFVYFNQKRADKRIIGLWMFMIFCLLFIMLAPGNFYRFEAEVLGLNPSFAMLGIYEKLMIGMRYTFGVMFGEMKVYLWMMNFCFLLLSVIKRRSILLTSIPFYIMSFKGVYDLYIRFNPFCRMCNDFHYILFNFQYFEPHYFIEWIHLIPIIIGITYVVFTIVSIYAVDDSFEDATFNGLVLISGISSAIILGFSPTINASGHRIFFVLAIQVILVLMIYLMRLYSHIKSRWVDGVLILIGSLWIIRIAFTFATISEFIVFY